MATPFANRRFITDEKIIREVLEACKIIHIGIQDGDGVYVVPTNYGYTYEDGKLTFFTHGARSGRKWDLIQKNPHVGFEIDTGFQLVDGGEVPCNFSNAYGSIIGSGRMSVVKDNEEKCRRKKQNRSGRTNTEKAGVLRKKHQNTRDRKKGSLQ